MSIPTQAPTPMASAAGRHLTPVEVEDLTVGMRRMGDPLPLRAYLAEMWERREFAVAVPLSELRAQNQNTVLGSLWHLLNPLLLAGVFYLVFGVILGARGGIENYPAFLIIGVFVFSYTQKAVMAGTRTITANLRLIQSLSFPRAVLPVAAQIGESIAQLPAMAALLVLVTLTGARPSPAWLLLVPLLALQALFNLGVSFFVARATFHFQDVAHLLPFVLRLWLYLSGVFFSVDFVPEGWMRTVFELNPAWPFIALTRASLMDGTTTGRLWVTALAWTVPLVVLGLLWFRRGEEEFGRG